MTSDLSNLNVRAMLVTECTAGFVEHMVPHHLREGLLAYVTQGRPTGGFLTSVLENDLCGAVKRADPIALAHLINILHFLLAVAPSPCWGSREKVTAWVAEGRRVLEQARTSSTPEENHADLA